jgi:hypothetical protein
MAGDHADALGLAGELVGDGVVAVDAEQVAQPEVLLVVHAHAGGLVGDAAERVALEAVGVVRDMLLLGVVGMPR